MKYNKIGLYNAALIDPTTATTLTESVLIYDVIYIFCLNKLYLTGV